MYPFSSVIHSLSENLDNRSIKMFSIEFDFSKLHIGVSLFEVICVQYQEVVVNLKYGLLCNELRH